MKISSTEKKDEFIVKVHKEGMTRLNKFFKLNLKVKIDILIVKDRKMINLLMGRETEKFIVAWASNNSIFILDRKNFIKESSHKYSKESYKALIIHEMAHVHYNYFSGGKINPKWLNEGISTFVSGQNKFRKKPEKFSKFLKSYYIIGESVYKEGGFFVEFLVNKFGKNKLLKLIKSLGGLILKKNLKSYSKKSMDSI